MTSARDPGSAKLELGELRTELLPIPLEYSALVPAEPAQKLRLLYLLHGGGGSRDFFNQARP